LRVKAHKEVTRLLDQRDDILEARGIPLERENSDEEI